MPTYRILMDGEEYTVSVDDGIIKVNGEVLTIDVQAVNAHTFSVLSNGGSTTIVARRHRSNYQVLVESCPLNIVVESERDILLRSSARAIGRREAKFEIRAPMPSLVVKVEVRVGDDVQDGTGLVILEAMKMENEIRAHHPAKVKQVLVENGKTVEKGELLIVLE